jgi:hypothetical protein
MKKAVLLFTVIVLVYASCKSDAYPGTYPSLVYTNNSSWSITFKNAAGESFTLNPGESLSRDSETRGRADIIKIEPPYATWQQNNGDIYDIRFVDRDKIEVEIENYVNQDIIVTEMNGYLYPSSVKVTSALAGGTYAGQVYVYTDSPSFASEGGYSWPIKKSKDRSTDKKFVIGINPPDGWS